MKLGLALASVHFTYVATTAQFACCSDNGFIYR
jgi:hypothetical protein